MQEIKAAFGRYMTGFFESLVPTTKAMEEFVARDIAKCMVWVPGRMVDHVEDMLSMWRKNDNSGTPANSSYLPIIIICLAKDYVPAFGDFSRQVSEPQWVVLPADPKERIFKLLQIQGERRAQIAIIAADEPTASSIARQLGLWLGRIRSRRFNVPYTFAGCDNEWPTMLESIDPAAANIETDEHNITILAVDLTLRETIPLFLAPKPGEPNDGKGSEQPGDPNGYPAVDGVSVTDTAAQRRSDQTSDGDAPIWSDAPTAAP